VHLTNLSANLSNANPALRSMLAGTSRAMQSHGASASGATQQAYAVIQSVVGRQASMLAYIDCFSVLGFAIMAMIPVVFLMKKSKPGGGMAVH
jgi:DHA2 family multidrug resistance protein